MCSTLSVEVRHFQRECQCVCQISLHIHIFHLFLLRLRKVTDVTIVKITLISVLLTVSGKALESLAMNCMTLVTGNIDGII
jgi:hypothetical protein